MRVDTVFLNLGECLGLLRFLRMVGMSLDGIWQERMQKRRAQLGFVKLSDRKI